MTAWLLAPARVRIVDAVVVTWCIVFAVLALTVRDSVSDLAELGASVVRVGTSVQETGGALGTLGALPLVGGALGDVAAQVEQTGREAVVQGRTASDSVARTALVLGLVTFLVPVAPVLGFWLLARFGYGRARPA